MGLLEFDPSWYYEVDLEWSPPVKVTGGLDALPECASEEYGVYRFERAHRLRTGPREIIRIGIAYDQYITTRAGQYVYLLERYRRRGDLWFSHAVLDLNGQHRRKRYEDVEHLLIFASQPCENEKKIGSVPQDDFYKVRNHGNRGALPREIWFPTMDVRW